MQTLGSSEMIGGGIGYLQKDRKNSPVKAPRIIITGTLQCAGGVKKLISFLGLLIEIAFYRSARNYFPSRSVHGVPGGYRKLIKHSATRAVP